MPAANFKAAINFAAELPIVSAATTDIGSLASNRVLVNGTVGVSSFGPVANQFRIVRFAAALVLQHSAALFLLTQANRPTVAGAIGGYVSDDAGNWHEIFYSGQSSEFAPGTAMLFVQAAAPTGWTKSATHNDKALRIVSGAGGASGGSSNFSAVFGTPRSAGGTALGPSDMAPLNGGGSALTIAHLPSTLQFLSTSAQNTNTGTSGGDYNNAVTDPGGLTAGLGAALYAGSAGTAHTHSLSLDLKFVDAIICLKN